MFKLKDNHKEEKEKFLSELSKKVPGLGRYDDIIKMKNVRYISTGSLTLDKALQTKSGIGLPIGVTDLFGAPSSGKTTLSLNVIREIQKTKGIPLFIDAERCLYRNRRWLEVNGVNPKELWIYFPRSGEDALDKVCEVIAKKSVDLVVIDSVPALIPKATLERELADGQKIGALALLMSQALQKITPLIDDSEVFCIFINQMRSQVTTTGREGLFDDATGGKALKFYASTRIGVKKIAGSEIVRNGVIIGHRVQVKVVKNKLGPPSRIAEFNLYYEGGIRQEEELFELLFQSGRILQRGPWFELDGNKFKGRSEGVLFLKQSENFKKYKDIIFRKEDAK